MSLFLESICVRNGIPQHLTYHERRMAYSAGKFFPLSFLIEEAHQIASKLVKCRLLYDTHTITHLEWLPYTPTPPKSLKVVEAPQLAYPFKYADRSALQELTSQKDTADDILIIKNGLLTDTSYCNIALFDGKAWYTPSCPLLAGTARARLLNTGILKAQKIPLTSLQNFQVLRVFNAMLDFEEGHDVRISDIIT